MKMGVSLYTMRDVIFDDTRGTLKKVHDMGYTYFEWMNFHADEEPGLGNGMTPAEAKRMFDECGIKVTGNIFVGADTQSLIFDAEKMQRIIDWYAEFGVQTLGIADDKFPSEDFLKRRLEAYNKIGEKCNEYGISWMYHNHFHELQRIAGKPIIDWMLEETDEDKVGFDLDLFWAMRGMLNPVKTIRRYGSRVKSIHAKDYPFDKVGNLDLFHKLDPDKPLTFDAPDYYDLAVPSDFIECGEDGITKWDEVIAAANAVGCPYMFIEQDFSTNSWDVCLKMSKEYLEKYNGLSFE